MVYGRVRRKVELPDPPVHTGPADPLPPYYYLENLIDAVRSVRGLKAFYETELRLCERLLWELRENAGTSTGERTQMPSQTENNQGPRSSGGIT